MCFYLIIKGKEVEWKNNEGQKYTKTNFRRNVRYFKYFEIFKVDKLLIFTIYFFQLKYITEKIIILSYEIYINFIYNIE